MRLLVSVRSAAEALAAVAGGADIVDAKEPSRGPLGAVELEVLREIAAVLPAAVPLSAALGDFDRPDAAAAAVRSASAPVSAPSRARGFLKLGVHGAADRKAVAAVLSAAVRAAGGRVGIVAAACAEGPAHGAPDPFEVARSAVASGAAGVLLDTWVKDGRGLLQWMPVGEIRRWVASVRQAGLLAAVAGSLDHAGVRALRGCGADILGVRGAACEGGRDGRVEAARVAVLRNELAEDRDRLTLVL